LGTGNFILKMPLSRGNLLLRIMGRWERACEKSPPQTRKNFPEIKMEKNEIFKKILPSKLKIPLPKLDQNYNTARDGIPTSDFEFLVQLFYSWS
jgi:hypothetical protein